LFRPSPLRCRQDPVLSAGVTMKPRGPASLAEPSIFVLFFIFLGFLCWVGFVAGLVSEFSWWLDGVFVCPVRFPPRLWSSIGRFENPHSLSVRRTATPKLNGAVDGSPWVPGWARNENRRSEPCRVVVEENPKIPSDETSGCRFVARMPASRPWPRRRMASVEIASTGVALAGGEGENRSATRFGRSARAGSRLSCLVLPPFGALLPAPLHCALGRRRWSSVNHRTKKESSPVLPGSRR